MVTMVPGYYGAWLLWCLARVGSFGQCASPNSREGWSLVNWGTQAPSQGQICGDTVADGCQLGMGAKCCNYSLFSRQVRNATFDV